MNKSIIVALQLGFTIAFSIIFFTVVGVMVDQWLNTLPIFTVIGVLFGAINGLYYLWKWVQQK